MTAEIITIASLKGGAGKTTTAFALACAAGASGLRALAIDLDPAFGLTAALGLGTRPLTISDALRGGGDLEAALQHHPLGIHALAADRRLAAEAPAAEQLRALLAGARSSYDVVVIDAASDGEAMCGPLAVADHVVIPSSLDILSMRAAALAAATADAAGALERISGLVIVDPSRPMADAERALLAGLLRNRLALETQLMSRRRWPVGAGAHASADIDGLIAAGKLLLREVATHTAPPGALRHFIALARSRPPATAAG